MASKGLDKYKYFIEVDGEYTELGSLENVTAEREEVKRHYIADEALGGVEREYVEVDREADVGDYVMSKWSEKIYTVTEVSDAHALITTPEQLGHPNGFYYGSYKTLSPTNIIRLSDGKRYELVDRIAEVGESIINKCDGDVAEVTEVGKGCAYTYTFEDKDGDVCFGMGHGYYYVLLPLEETTPQDDAQTLIANLASEVARLKREVAGLNRLTETHQSTIMQLLDHVDSNHKDIVKQAEEFAELTERVKTLEAQELVIDGEEIAEHLLTEVLMRERGTK